MEGVKIRILWKQITDRVLSTIDHKINHFFPPSPGTYSAWRTQRKGVWISRWVSLHIGVQSSFSCSAFIPPVSSIIENKQAAGGCARNQAPPPFFCWILSPLGFFESQVCVCVFCKLGCGVLFFTFVPQKGNFFFFIWIHPNKKSCSAFHCTGASFRRRPLLCTARRDPTFLSRSPAL